AGRDLAGLVDLTKTPFSQPAARFVAALKCVVNEGEMIQSTLEAGPRINGVACDVNAKRPGLGRSLGDPPIDWIPRPLRQPCAFFPTVSAHFASRMRPFDQFKAGRRSPTALRPALAVGGVPAKNQ